MLVLVAAAPLVDATLVGATLVATWLLVGAAPVDVPAAVLDPTAVVGITVVGPAPTFVLGAAPPSNTGPVSVPVSTPAQVSPADLVYPPYTVGPGAM